MNTASPIIETRPLPEGVASLQEMVKTQNLLIEKLMLQLAAQRRHRFGTRSEGLDQLGLGFEQTQKEQAARDALPPAPGKANNTTKKKTKRKVLSPDLPRDRQSFAPATTDCPCCEGPMRKFAEDIREVLLPGLR